MIERLHLHEVELGFAEPLVTPDGVYPSRRSILVGAEAGGVVGWGEAPAFPSRRWGTAEAAWAALESADVIRGEAPLPPIASAALQAATADLQARMAGLPFHRFLGAGTRRVVARHTLGLATEPGDLVERLGRLTAGGLKAIKVKIAPGRDAETVGAIRDSFPLIDLAVDANATYRSPADPIFERLAEARVSLIEQPFPAHDLAAHAELRRRGLIPVAVDEAIHSIGDVRQILRADAADLLSVKVNRLGLEAAKAILALAVGEGIRVKVGGTFDTAIGRRLLLAFAMLDGVADAEIAPPLGYLQADVADYPPLIEGEAAPDETPGIGASPDRERLARLEIRRTVVVA
ncbi:MAG: enolase C-terminal domain-like protein [Acidimicrobiia bacterium]